MIRFGRKFIKIYKMSIEMGLIAIGIFFVLVCFLAFYLTKKEKEKLEKIENFTDEELEEYNLQVEQEDERKRREDVSWFLITVSHLEK